MNTFLRLIASATILFSRPAIAAVVEYTVDSSASFVTVSGTFQGSPFTDQIPGSSTAHYSGSFRCELENGLLDIVGHEAISLFNPLPLAPTAPNGNDEPSAYGFRVTLPDSSEVLISISSISFYLSTNYHPPLDVADGFFAPSDLGFFLHGSTLLLAGGTIPLAYADLHGSGAPNTAASPGTFTNDGILETLTIPIATTFSLDTLSPDDLTLTLALTGQIVASRPVPEPSTALLLLCGGGLLFRNAGRRARR